MIYGFSKINRNLWTEWQKKKQNVITAQSCCIRRKCDSSMKSWFHCIWSCNFNCLCSLLFNTKNSFLSLFRAKLKNLKNGEKRKKRKKISCWNDVSLFVVVKLYCLQSYRIFRVHFDENYKSKQIPFHFWLKYLLLNLAEAKKRAKNTFQWTVSNTNQHLTSICSILSLDKKKFYFQYTIINTIHCYFKKKKSQISSCNTSDPMLL